MSAKAVAHHTTGTQMSSFVKKTKAW
jgi:hypothetical protein